MKYYGYVYLTTNLINNIKYIGMHKSEYHDKRYLGSGKLLMLAIKKYGVQNFKNEILHWCKTLDELCNKELETILEHNAHVSNDYYNIICTKTPVLIGKNNGFFGKKHSEKTKAHLSELRKNNPWSESRRNKHNIWIQSEDAKKLHLRYSMERSGVNLSESHKQKLKEIMSSPEVRAKLSKSSKDFYVTERGFEVRQKLAKECSERFKNKPKSETHKKAISDVLTGKSHYWQDLVNKNPEKIRKTALKNTGSKRTDEQKSNISKARKKYFEENECKLKGKLRFHNPLNPREIILCFQDEAPLNWIRGNPYKQYHSPCNKFHGSYIPGTEPVNWIRGRRCK